MQDGKNPMFVQFQSSPQILSKLGVMELMAVTVSAWKRRSSSERNALSRSCNAHSGFVIDVWHASHRKCAAASEREIEAWKKARGAAVAAAYEQLLQIAAADLAAAEHAADSECGRACVESHVSQVLCHSDCTAGTGSASARRRVRSCSSCDRSTTLGCGSRGRKKRLNGCLPRCPVACALGQTRSIARRTSVL